MVQCRGDNIRDMISVSFKEAVLYIVRFWLHVSPRLTLSLILSEQM